MERDINQTTLCRGGCGFYGSPITDGLCSQCFKETLKRKQDVNRLSPTSAAPVSSAYISEPHKSHVTPSSVVPAAEETPSSNLPKASTSHIEASVASAAIESAVKSVEETTGQNSSSSGDEAGTGETREPEMPGPSAPQKKKNRCHTCNKRVGLTGFECRCGGMFCGIHRYSDMHTCSFDYKSLGAAEIRKNNPIVVSEKIKKI